MATETTGVETMDSLIVRLLSLPEVQSSIPYSTSQIWRLEQQGHFPKRVRIGPNRVGWIEAEINDWLSSKIKERGQ
jgi:prophage regulatory protein